MSCICVTIDSVVQKCNQWVSKLLFIQFFWRKGNISCLGLGDIVKAAVFWVAKYRLHPSSTSQANSGGQRRIGHCSSLVKMALPRLWSGDLLSQCPGGPTIAAYWTLSRLSFSQALHLSLFLLPYDQPLTPLPVYFSRSSVLKHKRLKFYFSGV